MLHIAICDDEAVAAESIATALRRKLADLEQPNEIAVFTGSRAFTEQLGRGTRFDALFLDIDMPELDGIRLGTLYRAQLADTILIYVSNREDLVFDAFAAKPFRFIRKRRFMEKLPGVLHDMLLERKEREGRKIFFPCGANNGVMLWPERISYVEAVRKKQMIHCENKTYEVSSSFQKIMEQLDPHGFVRTHKSFLVNCRFIRTIVRSDLVLDDGEIVPISRSYFKLVQDSFRKWASSMSNMT